MPLRFLSLAMLLSPGALAAQTLGIPAGCQAILTVQHASCRVAHYVTCSNDAPGVRHRVDVYPDGFDYIAATDADGQWLGSVDAYAGTRDQPAGPAANSVSFEALLRGSDSYDFSMIDAAGVVTRFTGTDTLTGETTTLDGETVLPFTFEIKATNADGTEDWSATGTAYAHPEWRIGFSGITNWVVPGDAYSTDDTPAALIEPGEPGFLSTVAEFGCAS